MPDTVTPPTSRRSLLIALVGSTVPWSRRSREMESRTSNPACSTATSEEALFASGPAAELGDDGLYAGLIGSWNVDIVDYLADGPRRTAGEWHFAWVLEGRAVQDVLIAPPRTARPSGLETIGNRYGTSLRFYDPRTRQWALTWINPVTGAYNRLVARKEGDAIVQVGTDDQGAMHRWTFVEVTRDRFHWRGDISRDGGTNWTTGAEFFGRRMNKC